MLTATWHWKDVKAKGKGTSDRSRDWFRTLIPAELGRSLAIVPLFAKPGDATAATEERLAVAAGVTAAVQATAPAVALSAAAAPPTTALASAAAPLRVSAPPAEPSGPLTKEEAIMDNKKSWWSRRGKGAKVALVFASLVVLAVLAGVLTPVICDALRPSAAELAQTLITSADAQARQKAATDLAARRSPEATKDVVAAADTSVTAEEGL